MGRNAEEKVPSKAGKRRGRGKHWAKGLGLLPRATAESALNRTLAELTAEASLNSPGHHSNEQAPKF